MTESAEHPTVRKYKARALPEAERPLTPLDAAELRGLCLDAGADDAGLVAIDHPEIASQRAEILALLPTARTLISFVSRMSRENIRTPMRSIANLEFHHATDDVNGIAREIVRRLEAKGLRALNGGAAGFPMEADRWPGKMWLISHKPVAVAGGLGRIGIHRNVIHPKFGNFVLLGTVVIEAEVSAYAEPFDYNPCLECKLCVAACPTGAIAPDGHFDFSTCYTHNYREFMGGFGDWVETIAASDDARDYRARVTPSETVSMWQSLSFGANYKAAYCMSVCPAGEDVISPYLAARKGYVDSVVRPLREKAETVCVARGSDAESHVARHFPNKRTKVVGNGLGGQASIAGFLRGLPLVFQRGRSQGLAAVYHFTFTCKEEVKATVEIRDKKLTVRAGHEGVADLGVTADSETWLRFLRKETNLAFALLRRKIRLRGSPRLLLAFGRCFPS